MKKLLAFVLTFAFVCSLTIGSIGCSGKDKDKTEKKADETKKADEGKKGT